jgi:hypothetical protein
MLIAASPGFASTMSVAAGPAPRHPLITTGRGADRGVLLTGSRSRDRCRRLPTAANAANARAAQLENELAPGRGERETDGYVAAGVPPAIVGLPLHSDVLRLGELEHAVMAAFATDA